jgi:predicted component of type VI protein secretion system
VRSYRCIIVFVALAVLAGCSTSERKSDPEALKRESIELQKNRQKEQRLPPQ